MKRITKRIALSMVLILCLSVFMCLLPSCTKSENGDGGGNKGASYTLTVWGAQEDQTMLREMCEAYAAANPQNRYTFQYGVQGEGEAANVVLNDVTAGPDVYSFASDQIYRLYAGGALARLGGDIETEVKAANSEGSVDASTVSIGGEDHLYAYPMAADNCYFLYYDKRVFTDESALGNLDDMLDVAEAAGKKVLFKLNDDGWYLSSFFFAIPELKYEVEYNEGMAEKSVSINYNNAAGVDVMRALRHYVNRDGMVVQTDDSKIIAAFTPNAAGKTEAAAAVSGTWNAAAIKSLLGENMGVCKLPTATIGGEEIQLSGFMGYKLVGVNGYSKNKGEAHKLAAWLTSEQNQLKRYEMRGIAPTNKVVAEDSRVKADPIIATVLEQAKHNRAQKGVPANYWTPMASLITPIVAAKANGAVVTDAQLKEYLDALCAQIRK